MELPTPTTPLLDLEFFLLILGISIVTALAVYFVSVFGIKEKSFEEAILEQKTRSELLLGKIPPKKKQLKPENAKSKKKEAQKRSRNVGEKGEELKELKGEELEEEPVVLEKVGGKKHIEIVDFVDVVEITTPPARRPSLSSATPTKSILHHPTTPPPAPQTPPPEVVNHFSTILPKDDAELLLERQEKLAGGEKMAEKLAVVDKKPAKIKRQPQNLPLLIQTTQLSQSETQNLIDLLLNKQNPEWVPTSPSSKDSLKKLLTSKTTQIQELESNLTSLTQKLTLLRTEQTSDRSKFTQIKKQLEDLINNKQRQLLEFSLKNDEMGKNFILAKQRVEECGRREGEWRGKVESLEREIGALKVSMKNQGSQLSSAFDSNSLLKKSLETQESHTISLTTSLHNLESSLHHANNLINEKDSQILLLSQKLDTQNSSEHELNALLTKIQHLERSKGELERRCEELGKNEVNLKKGLEGEVGRLEGEVGVARGKNDELRAKNSALLSSLQSTESQLDAKLAQISALEMELEKGNESKRVVVKALENVGIVFCETTLQQSLAEKLAEKSQPEEILPNPEMAEKLAVEVEKCCKLTEEVIHYQSVLASTESLLASLQASIEGEEAKWVERLREKDEKLEELRKQKKEEEQGEEAGRNGHGDHTHNPPTTPTKASTPLQSPSPSISMESGELTPSPGEEKEKKKKKKVFGFLSAK